MWQNRVIDKILVVIFKKYPNLNFFNSLVNCPLIIDDSCETFYNEKKYVKLATAGRDKNFNIIK